MKIETALLQQLAEALSEVDESLAREAAQAGIADAASAKNKTLTFEKEDEAEKNNIAETAKQLALTLADAQKNNNAIQTFRASFMRAKADSEKQPAAADTAHQAATLRQSGSVMTALLSRFGIGTSKEVESEDTANDNNPEELSVTEKAAEHSVMPSALEDPAITKAAQEAFGVAGCDTRRARRTAAAYSHARLSYKRRRRPPEASSWEK